MKYVLWMIFVLLAVSSLFLFSSRAQNIAVPDSATNAWLQTWIDKKCCVTNNCCFEVPLSSLNPLPNDSWQIRSTGQILKRTDFSQDGKYWRCACDMINGVWTVHERAFTRCIFPPMSLTAK